MVRLSLAIGALPVCILSYPTISAFAPIFPLPSRLLLLPPRPANHHLDYVSSRSSSSGSTTTTALFGIPKMFRWLTDQYPNINKRINEGLAANTIQVDNLYLDMNGIIHPCTHGNAEGVVIVLDETAMFKKIFLYVDR